ncbi:unnamed protein product [Brassica oleracea var. botrytis]|uniref:Uncharacterized protein n=1 Tax=Brassica oleracea TaxID=3712 RepID=A0A3P6E2Q8_BRAOL|nr:unnamed protein product [Brassica oleracea]
MDRFPSSLFMTIIDRFPSRGAHKQGAVGGYPTPPPGGYPTPHSGGYPTPHSGGYPTPSPGGYLTPPADVGSIVLAGSDSVSEPEFFNPFAAQPNFKRFLIPHVPQLDPSHLIPSQDRLYRLVYPSPSFWTFTCLNPQQAFAVKADSITMDGEVRPVVSPCYHHFPNGDKVSFLRDGTVWFVKPPPPFPVSYSASLGCTLAVPVGATVNFCDSINEFLRDEDELGYFTGCYDGTSSFFFLIHLLFFLGNSID